MEWIIQNKKWKVAELKLAYKTRVNADLRPKVSSSKDSYAIFKENWDMTKIELVEQFKVLLTNRANKCLGVVDISTGGISGTVADPKIILAAALKCGACGFVLCHYGKQFIMESFSIKTRNFSKEWNFGYQKTLHNFICCFTY